MKDFITHFITLLEILIGLVFFYASLYINFGMEFFNVGLFIIGLFILIEICGRVDKLSGYGKNRDLETKHKTHNKENK